MLTNNILECKDLIKIYESTNQVKIPALRGFDLTIKEGELISIIGPSGTGKSTFIRAIGMIEQLSSGEIIYNGLHGQIIYSKTFNEDKIRFRREICGYLFQLPEHNLLYNLTAFQNVMLPMQIVGKLPHEEQKKRAHELLDLLGLKNRVNHLPSRLSGGEAQRVGICIALANDSQLILADEPTGELDSKNTLKIINYFQKLNAELGKTFIVVTHDKRFSNMSDKVYRIEDGRIKTMYLPIEKGKYEQIITISTIGELALPLAICQRHQINHLIKLSLTNKYIEITSADELSQVTSNNEEIIYISDDGRFILPRRYQSELNFGKKVKIQSDEDVLRLIPVK